MARILLGWELGANRGHWVRLSAIARRLAEQGHEIALAAQRLSGGFELPERVTQWQAPVWPRLLGSVGPMGGPAPNTMGDILVRMGLDGEDVLPSLIQGWEAIFAAFRPDVVVADFAPALLCAVRGRCASIIVGSGFDTVPATLASFPSMTGQPAAYGEAEALDRINRGLSQSGRAPLERFPQMFEADRVLPGTFAELDFHARWRTGPVVAPSVAHPVGEAGEGEEVFLYADSSLLRTAPLWDGLVRAALPTRVYAQGASAAQHTELEKLGLRVERQPIPFAEIARRSRVVMSYGGLGFTSSALAAGVPSVVVHYDLEKRLNGEAITRLQLGGHVYAGAIQADAFATSLRQLYQNDSFQRRARELALSFRERLYPTQEEMAVQALGELLA
ncbi:MAG: glycosyl transferase-like UDP-glucuronosyltransferase [Proteobacteria bacterium]|nr:glycosyl transferase-like UDP-glucuronosyltransferase [Pseudomonadota bacterium]